MSQNKTTRPKQNILVSVLIYLIQVTATV